ncbi:MAG: helix-turn-helix domain-containing protein [Vicinamibacterales bacterium]
MDDLITSAEAARILGVGATAIKRWSNAGSLTCIKTPGGHRRFSRAEIERLREPASQTSVPRDWSDWIDVLLREGSAHLVHARLMTERGRTGAWHTVAANLGDLLAEIGRRWATGALSVVEEHILSTSLQRALATVSDTLPVAPGSPRCLLAAVEGDQHTLGLSLVELCLREAGWRAEWVGAPTRTNDVLERVSAGAVEMVAMSASEFCVDPATLAAIVDQLADRCRSARVGLVLGGNGVWPEPPTYGVRFRSLPSFYQYLADYRRPR